MPGNSLCTAMVLSCKYVLAGCEQDLKVLPLHHYFLPACLAGAPLEFGVDMK